MWVESKDGSYGATITAIGSDAIWVRRSEDNSKVATASLVSFCHVHLTVAGLHLPVSTEQGQAGVEAKSAVSLITFSV